MNDILFGNNNSEVITKLSKRYFKKNKVRLLHNRKVPLQVSLA